MTRNSCVLCLLWLAGDQRSVFVSTFIMRVPILKMCNKQRTSHDFGSDNFWWFFSVPKYVKWRNTDALLDNCMPCKEANISKCLLHVSHTLTTTGISWYCLRERENREIIFFIILKNQVCHLWWLRKREYTLSHMLHRSCTVSNTPLTALHGFHQVSQLTQLQPAHERMGGTTQPVQFRQAAQFCLFTPEPSDLEDSDNW